MACKEQEELPQSSTNEIITAENDRRVGKDETKPHQSGGSVNQQQERLEGSLPGKNQQPPGDGKCEQQQQGGLEGSLQGLTKNQLRKLKKRQMWEKKKENRAEYRREKRQERKRKRQEETAEKGPGVPQPESVPRKKKMKKRMSDSDASDVTIVIDCGFDDLMKECDVTKLSKQIQRSYSSNRTSDKPFQFYICNFKDKTKARFDRAISEYPKWDVHFREQGLPELFSKESIVYLTSDSPQVLQGFDPKKVYVIGGLVDHNHQKGICYKRAVEQGWGHAQLPIGEYMKFQSRKVLTVNHVYEILVAFNETENWKDAFDRVIPQRKFHTISRRERRRRKAQLKDGERDSGNAEVEEHSSGESDDGQEEAMHDGSKGQGSCSEQFVEKSRTRSKDSSSVAEIGDNDSCGEGDVSEDAKVRDESNSHQKCELGEKTNEDAVTTQPKMPADRL